MGRSSTYGAVFYYGCDVEMPFLAHTMTDFVWGLLEALNFVEVIGMDADGLKWKNTLWGIGDRYAWEFVD